MTWFLGPGAIIVTIGLPMCGQIRPFPLRTAWVVHPCPLDIASTGQFPAAWLSPGVLITAFWHALSGRSRAAAAADARP